MGRDGVASTWLLVRKEERKKGRKKGRKKERKKGIKKGRKKERKKEGKKKMGGSDQVCSGRAPAVVAIGAQQAGDWRVVRRK